MTPHTVPRQVRCYAHIPLARFPDGIERVDLSEGMVLAPMPYELWARLDRSASVHKSGFVKTAPVFLAMAFEETKAVDPQDTFETSRRHFDQHLYAVYFMLLLHSASRLPEPDLSKQYYVDPAVGSATLRDAVFGYEALAEIKGEGTVVLQEQALTALPEAIRLVIRVGRLLDLPEVEYVRDVLYRYARPEFSDRADFLHCIAAMESLLVPRPTHGVAKTFAMRGGVLMAQTFEGKEAVGEIFKCLYDARSRIVHGEDLNPSAERLATRLPGIALMPAARWLLCNLLLKLFGIADQRSEYVTSIPNFVASLDDASVDAVSYTTLGLARNAEEQGAQS